MLDYTKCPNQSIAGQMREYIENGHPTGEWMEALISNDLREACGRADEINKEALFDWVSFMYCEAPMECWGSREAYQKWISDGGLHGRAKWTKEPTLI